LGSIKKQSLQCQADIPLNCNENLQPSIYSDDYCNLSRQTQQTSTNDFYFMQSLLAKKDVFYLQKEIMYLHQQFQDKELQLYFNNR
jgi:hypothetical protein